MQADLLSHFKTLEDPRIDRTKRYPLIEIIFLIISATISGCEGWKSIRDFGLLKLQWLRQFLPYENGIPVDDTIARVMRKLLDRSGDLEQNLGKLRAIPILFSFTTGLSEWLIHKSIGQESFQCLG
jgi:hypothetical protein